jgi:hypothetical protein
VTPSALVNIYQRSGGTAFRAFYTAPIIFLVASVLVFRLDLRIAREKIGEVLEAVARQWMQLHFSALL